jgi:hypothetical protein
MKIDYMANPEAIVKKFSIPYGENGRLRLDGIIRASEEEGLDEANWFYGELRYPKTNHKFNYIGVSKTDKLHVLFKDMTHGALTLEDAEAKFKKFCEYLGLKVLPEETPVSAG